MRVPGAELVYGNTVGGMLFLIFSVFFPAPTKNHEFLTNNSCSV